MYILKNAISLKLWLEVPLGLFMYLTYDSRLGRVGGNRYKIKILNIYILV